MEVKVKIDQGKTHNVNFVGELKRFDKKSIVPCIDFDRPSSAITDHGFVVQSLLKKIAERQKRVAAEIFSRQRGLVDFIPPEFSICSNLGLL